MAIWCITIPALGVYEQREGDTVKAQAYGCVIAMAGGCTPELNTPWAASDPWAYQRQVRLPAVIVPDRSKHGWLEAVRCRLGFRCSQCNDSLRILRIGDDDGHQMAMPVRIPGRRTLLDRNRLGEYGVLRVALVHDIMMGLPPDPEAVREWERYQTLTTPKAAQSLSEVNQ